MPARYPSSVRRQVVELARAGTRVAQLAETFGMTDTTTGEQTINRLRQFAMPYARPAVIRHHARQQLVIRADDARQPGSNGVAGGMEHVLVSAAVRSIAVLLRSREREANADAICRVWYIQLVVKTTIYLPDELHQGIKHAAKERGTSEAELIRTAVRHELLGAPADQQERAQRRGRLLAAMGKLDSSAYPADYLDELRAQWRG
jgi:Ribbon-helix-helix protein, copG family